MYFKNTKIYNELLSKFIESIKLSIACICSSSYTWITLDLSWNISFLACTYRFQTLRVQTGKREKSTVFRKWKRNVDKIL